MRTLLIDGDILVVSTGAVLEKEVDWGDDEWTLTCDVKQVKETVLGTIRRLERDLEADRSIITLSQGTTFRHEMYDGYKKGRSRKPVGTNEVKRWLIEEHDAKLKPGIEADDVMGILSTNPRIIKGEKIIVSQDKDMLTIPGKVYRSGEIIEVSEAEATRYWLLQTLTGDVTDGYPGCPGMGPVKAKKHLDEIPEGEYFWPHIVAAFEAVGKTAEDALMQARLARILHNDDYDHVKKEPILWLPSL